jgi:hypothetical protein
VPTDGLAPDQPDDPEAVTMLSDKVKDTIQAKLDELVADRGPAFS